jgi:uncharacterized RmlC-like cupin family protein
MTTATATAPALARFQDLVPYQSQHADNGIPREVMEYLAANKVFPVVCPPGLVGRNALAPLRGWPGLCISIAQCTPQQGPVSHNHTGTLENFFCLDGRFDVLWGNRLENKVTLEPGDLCSMPPGVYRAFRNLTDSEARLLVLIQGDDKMSDKVQMPRAIGTEVREKHGDKVMDLLAGINMRFEGDDVKEIPPAQIQARVTRMSQLAASSAGGGETVYPILSPEAGGAPVENWPGLNVAMLMAKAGEASTASVDGAHCQWVVNLGDAPCEVDVAGDTTVLNRFDLMRVEPGATRTVRGTGGAPVRVLLATQGKETIAPQAIQ